jgi:hypothetical protein
LERRWKPTWTSFKNCQVRIARKFVPDPGALKSFQIRTLEGPKSCTSSWLAWWRAFVRARGSSVQGENDVRRAPLLPNDKRRMGETTKRQKRGAMSLRCPKCQSTLFHVKEDKHGKQQLCCYRSRKCGWRAEIKPPIRFTQSLRRSDAPAGTEWAG